MLSVVRIFSAGVSIIEYQSDARKYVNMSCFDMLTSESLQGKDEVKLWTDVVDFIFYQCGAALIRYNRIA